MKAASNCFSVSAVSRSRKAGAFRSIRANNSATVFGLPGKPDGISGGDVDAFYRSGRIREIAEYCESDVVNTYRIWLRHELFRGRLSTGGSQASEAGLVDFIKARCNTKPHLADLT